MVLENLYIMESKLVNGAFHWAGDLTGSTESIFMIGKEIGKIAVPQISRKTIGAGHFYQPVHAAVKQRFGLARLFWLKTADFQGSGHVFQDISLLKISV